MAQAQPAQPEPAPAAPAAEKAVKREVEKEVTQEATERARLTEAFVVVDTVQSSLEKRGIIAGDISTEHWVPINATVTGTLIDMHTVRRKIKENS